jgi:hypothetical protein
LNTQGEWKTEKNQDINRQAVESDDEEKQITKSEIDKKRGCGPFRS